MVTERTVSRYGTGILLSALAHAAFFTLFIRIQPDVTIDIIAPVTTHFVTVTRPPAPPAPAPRTQTPAPPQPKPAPPEPAVIPEAAPEPAVTAEPAPPVAAAPAAPQAPAAPDLSAKPVPPRTVTAAQLSPGFKPLRAPAPSYPNVALNLELEGTVVVKALVDPDGNVTDMTILKLDGHPSFGRAALAAVKARRYTPPTAGDEPVFVWIEIPFEFTLEDF